MRRELLPTACENFDLGLHIDEFDGKCCPNSLLKGWKQALEKFLDDYFSDPDSGPGFDSDISPYFQDILACA